MEPPQIHITGLGRVQYTLQCLQEGLESELTDSDRECLDKIMGRICDIAKDYHMPITPYVVWLGNYRISERHVNNGIHFTGDGS